MTRTSSTIPWLGAFALACSAWTLVAPAMADPAPGSLVADWNQEVLEVAEAEDRFLTLKGLRTAAMMHLAIHDALNAIRPRYTPWLETPPAPGAAPTAAAAQAAFVVARSQYPDRAARFRTELERWLARVEDGPPKTAAIELGNATAAAVLEDREGDRWDGEADYRWQPPGPGVYAPFPEHSGTPEGFVFGAGWARARPFTLEDASQFRAPPPPPVDSAEYTRAFDEVRELGAFDSPTRTADQAHLAMWWKDFVESSHNRLARRLVRDEGLDLWAAARTFALLNVSVYDAYVAVFDDKLFFNHWRPYTAIRAASSDGNPDTRADPDWDNLHRHTYAFPSYPSAHGAACAAAATVLADSFGAERPVTMTTERVARAGPLSETVALDPPTRRFDSFAAAAEECALSRVYLGIHFRYDSVAGNRLGREVASHALALFLRPREDGPP